MSGLAELLLDVAGGLGIPAAGEDALSFVKQSGMMPSGRRQRLSSDVAPGPLPIEISFSQASPCELRLLIEPCRPGEGILARTEMAIAAVGNATKMFSAEVAQHAQDLVRQLLPDAEHLSHLSWRSSVWLALRTNGERSGVRIYVNGQYGSAPERWRRIARAFTECGLEQSRGALDRVRQSVSDLLQPIGLCFDVRPSGLAPARVHGVTEKISPFWLLRLLSATGNEDAAEDVADFLDLFGILESRGACPILVSVGLDADDEANLKIDVDVPTVQPDIEVRRRARYLDKAEKRFGKITAYHSVSGSFNGVRPRYIGITVRPDSRFLNVYFPDSRASDEEVLVSPEQSIEKAGAFVHTQMKTSGALLMDARSSSRARVVPENWQDIYMTCLLIQEHFWFPYLDCEALDRARSCVRAAREGWSWRYLPDLPLDLDDTAMAWAALDPTERGIDCAVVGQVMALRNSDGGFRTFIGEAGESQLSHPAVTLNVVFALDAAQTSWPRAATNHYLEGWLRQPDFPACQWMGSPLLPIYLFARTTSVLEQIGTTATRRLAARVLELRRSDGTWGGELPDSLSTALAVVTLDRLGMQVSGVESLSRFFLESQFEDGGWGWSPLYSDGSGTWFGHRAITTMFVISAVRTLEYSM